MPCRRERLLKALREGRYNARKEYREALKYYHSDLPKTASAGNILLANDQIRILHDMFLADASMLSEGLAGRLKSVIANQFALNAFYDLVQRHNDAVNAGNWSRPFPLDEAKSFFGAVEDNTPRWFEPQVEQGLRQVEQAQPPAAEPPEAAPASAIEPPPLPPGTPDARDSWRRRLRLTRYGRRFFTCRSTRKNGARRRTNSARMSGRYSTSCARRSARSEAVAFACEALDSRLRACEGIAFCVLEGRFLRTQVPRSAAVEAIRAARGRRVMAV
jgi:hypothetical protein